MEGLKGNGAADFHWRWQPSAEAQWLQPGGADVANAGRSASSSEPLVATAEDWVGFRGERRDGTISGIQIATDWDRQPPRLAWRTRVGPAWSSIVVVGERLFTQEQRGEREVVSCFDANSGSQLWIHEDQGRYEENLGGVGPRATPTFAAGRIFAQGAAGRLNCLDAVTGQPVWSRDIVADASARVPTWGFSGSPLGIVPK
jgi:outer membrane protein assembly factor BamB